MFLTHNSYNVNTRAIHLFIRNALNWRKNTFTPPIPPHTHRWTASAIVQQWRRWRFRRLRIAMSAASASALSPLGAQCRYNVGHGRCVYGVTAVLGDGRVHGRTPRLAGRLVVAPATDGPRPHVLPDRPKYVHVLRYEDHLRRGGRQWLADSARCVYIPGLITR